MLERSRPWWRARLARIDRALVRYPALFVLGFRFVSTGSERSRRLRELAPSRSPRAPREPNGTIDPAARLGVRGMGDADEPVTSFFPSGGSRVHARHTSNRQLRRSGIFASVRVRRRALGSIAGATQGARNA